LADFFDRLCDVGLLTQHCLNGRRGLLHLGLYFCNAAIEPSYLDLVIRDIPLAPNLDITADNPVGDNRGGIGVGPGKAYADDPGARFMSNRQTALQLVEN